MLKGIDKNGNVKDVVINEDGSISVGGETKINNADNKPIPVKIIGQGETNTVEVIQTSDQESVLRATIETLSTTAETITVGKKVTVISIANYADEDDITMVIGTKTYQIGAGLAIDFPINDTVESFTLASTGDDTKAQLIVRGVE